MTGKSSLGFTRYFRCFTLAMLGFAALIAFPPSTEGRRPNELVLANSAEDPALIARIVSLSPTVDPNEARIVTRIAYNTGRELAAKWHMGASPTVHSFLINIGMRKAGYCYQFAGELQLRLVAQNLKTLEFHWAESDPRTDTEHNVIVVTARNQPFEQGVMLDNWRHSGHLLWGPLNGDPSHTWKENKPEYNRRLHMPSLVDPPKAEAKIKKSDSAQ